MYYWLTTKAPEWQYEKEIRAINIRDEDYCTFDKNMIKEIIFGYRTDGKQKEKLLNNLRLNGYSDGIEINEIDIDKENINLIVKKSALNN